MDIRLSKGGISGRSDEDCTSFAVDAADYGSLYAREKERQAASADSSVPLVSFSMFRDRASIPPPVPGVPVQEPAPRGRRPLLTKSSSTVAAMYAGNGHGATHWSADDDRLLLLGVAACGVGRWSDIREEFTLSRNSSQMNQRFTR
jgi:hypothetical protein